MKRLSVLVSILAALAVNPASGSMQNDDIRALFSVQVSQSGCCKVRQSAQHPWSKTGRSFAQCDEINKKEGDSIYNSSGQVWWDSSC